MCTVRILIDMNLTKFNQVSNVARECAQLVQSRNFSQAQQLSAPFINLPEFHFAFCEHSEQLRRAFIESVR